MLAATAEISVPTRPLVAWGDYICRLKCQTHGWQSVARLYPMTADGLEPLAHIVAQLGIVLAAPTFTTCEQVVLSYEHLLASSAARPAEPIGTTSAQRRTCICTPRAYFTGSYPIRSRTPPLALSNRSRRNRRLARF